MPQPPPGGGSADLLRSAALAYAAAGLAVLPVGRDKAPATRHGVKDASAEPEKVRAMLWDRAHGIGVAVGASRLTVIDCDRHPGCPDGVAAMRELEREHGELPRTWRARSQSGGEHIYFRANVAELRGKLAPGVDVLHGGRYVIVAPTPGYAWIAGPDDAPLAELPQWIADLAERKASKPRAMPATEAVVAGEPYIAAAVQGEAAVLAGTPPGDRGNALYRSAAALGELEAHGLSEAAATDALLSASEANGLMADNGERYCRDVIRRGWARGRENPRLLAERRPADGLPADNG